MKEKIIVYMDGGLIHYVDIPKSLQNNVIVEVRDFDMDFGFEPDEVQMRRDTLGNISPCTVTHWHKPLPGNNCPDPTESTKLYNSLEIHE